MLLMRLQPILSILPLHRRIRPRLRKRQLHLLPQHVEAVQLVNRILSRFHRVEDYEGLTFGFDVLFGDDVYDIAIFFEDFADGLDELGDFNALVQIADLLCWD